MEQNPEKVHEWYTRAKTVKQMSDSLYDYATLLKELIAKKADGAEGDYRHLANREDLEASTAIMLSIEEKRGLKLYNAINNYREQILTMITDSVQRQVVIDLFNTEVPKRDITMMRNWQEYNFENMPAIAAITLLTKLQNDIRYTEGEVLHQLAKNIDEGDVRVNKISALVIPNSKNIVRGSDFSAQIILAAVDSTQCPEIFIDDKKLETENGEYTITCNRTGDYTLNGYMVVNDGSGASERYDFSQKYTVVDPTATVSASLMNVLYAGFENPVSISVPGVPAKNISANVANGNGTLKSDGKGGFVAVPKQIGKNMEIEVTANHEGGRRQSMGKYSFRVKQLPDPSPFIEYKDKDGHTKRYRGGTPFAKRDLMSTNGIIAAIDDGLLNIGFKVLSFETVFYDNMGNAVPVISDGANFSARQKDMFRRLSTGKRFYISHVKAIGPDGVERVLPSSMEVILK
jgi:gliding motility-associated protein GldM